jgi:hypothetical protein
LDNACWLPARWLLLAHHPSFLTPIYRCLSDFGFALTTASTWAAVGQSLMLSIYVGGVAE